jgi:transcription initiation factor TFIIB
LVQGRSIDSIATASVYAACRCGDCMRTLSEVVTVAGCDAQKARNAYQVLNVKLGLKAKPPRPIEFVPRISSICSVSDVVRQRARELAKQAESAGLSNGRQASSVAAACLYLAGQKACTSVTQAEIAEAANTTPQTIRTRYRELQAELE